MARRACLRASFSARAIVGVVCLLSTAATAFAEADVKKEEAAATQPQASFTNSIGMKLVWIKPGTFTMGSPATEEGHDDNEEPPHPVTLTKGFHMGACLVTVGQFRQFVGATGYRTDAERGGQSFEDGRRGGYTITPEEDYGWRENVSWRNPGFRQTDDRPVVLVSWNDATAFCKWLSDKEGRRYRLPTEAEWEYACRAGTTTRYYFGDSTVDLEDCVWSCTNSDGQTHPVGQKRPNAWGLYDMIGNAWELCQDWYANVYYWTSPVSDPTGLNEREATPFAWGKARVRRCGAWNDDPEHCRVAGRYGKSPAYRGTDGGFRVVCVAGPTAKSEARPIQTPSRD